jgi:parallel beta-helix repeat protein
MAEETIIVPSTGSEPIIPLPPTELFEPPRIPRYKWGDIVGGDIKQEGDIVGNLATDPATIAETEAATAYKSFLDLIDTPDTYVGQTGLFVKVNAGETALEFGAGGGGGIKTATYVVAPTGTDADYNTDGVDDQVTIKEAIDDLPAGGGRVILREGVYTFSAALSILHSDVILEGQGTGVIITLADTTDTDIIYAGDYDENLSFTNIKIKNIEIDGNKANQSDYGTGIYAPGTTDYLYVENCYIHDTDDSGIQTGAKHSIVINNIIIDTDGYSIYFWANSQYSLAQGNNIISTASSGINALSAFVTINANFVYYNHDSSTGYAAIESGGSSNIISNNFIVLKLNNNVGIKTRLENMVIGNLICSDTGTGNTSYGIWAVDRVTVIGNSVHVANDNNVCYGVYMYAGSYNGQMRIENNMFFNCQVAITSGGYRICDTIIANNYLEDYTNAHQEGILLGSSTAAKTSYGNIITGNVIKNFGKEGIKLTNFGYSTISNNTIYNAGRLTDNTYAAILLQAGGVGYSIYNVLSGNIINNDNAKDPAYGIRENSANDGPNIVTSNVVLNCDTANISLQHVSSINANNLTA